MKSLKMSRRNHDDFSCLSMVNTTTTHHAAIIERWYMTRTELTFCIRYLVAAVTIAIANRPQAIGNSMYASN